MSRQNDHNKKAFFQKSMMRAQTYQKRKTEIAKAKSGQVMDDPKEVVESTGEVVPDPDIVEEA